MTDSSASNANRGPDRPVRRKHGLGIFCTVCICRGESRTVFEFDDRESLIEHYAEEHDW